MKKLFGILLSFLIIFSIILSLPINAADIGYSADKGMRKSTSRPVINESVIENDSEITYQLALDLYGLEVSLTSNTLTNTINANVYCTFTIGFPKLVVAVDLYSIDRYGILYKVASNSTFDLNIFQTLTASYNSDETGLYMAEVNVSCNGEAMDTYYTYNIAFNKNAQKFPMVYDAFRGTRLESPLPGMAVVPSNLRDPGFTSQTQREAYRRNYEITYFNGRFLDWNGVQIHHIQPLKYGGLTVFYNLIPLSEADHYSVSTWWLNY